MQIDKDSERWGRPRSVRRVGDYGGGVYQYGQEVSAYRERPTILRDSEGENKRAGGVIRLVESNQSSVEFSS